MVEKVQGQQGAVTTVADPDVHLLPSDANICKLAVPSYLAVVTFDEPGTQALMECTT